MRNVTIEERLVEYASLGYTKGFRLNIWHRKASQLSREGIRLTEARPTGREGESRYKIDFSVPIPGTFSQTLFDLATSGTSKKV